MPIWNWNRLKVASIAALLTGAGFLQAADPALIELFRILRDRGSISQTEFDLLNGLASKPSTAPATDAGVPTPVPAAPTSPSLAPVVSAPSNAAPSTPTGKSSTAAAPSTAATAEAPATADETLKDFGKRLLKLESIKDGTSSELIEKALADKWYQRYDVGGYAQFRYTTAFQGDSASLNVPNDRTATEGEGLLIRRGRFKLSGDVTKRVYLYTQVDLAGSVGGSGDLGLQARDLYADIGLDEAHQYRVRAGLSKVPFGWVNLQSSQNRAPMERPDALNSAVEGERDLGLYFMYAPPEVRKRFKELVKSGLKGSGDYGMATVGAFNGQGLNRSDLNGEPHLLGRVSYPFKFDNGQFFETGIQGYEGRFVPTAQAITVNGKSITPRFDSDGVTDRRAGISAILYPQPFGIETEWNIGKGPQLSQDFTEIDSDSLYGGYVMANYRIKSPAGAFFPFSRWHYYEGGRKFGRNAPNEDVNEIDFGLEWSPWTELEASISYTHTLKRTDTRAFPYKTVEDVDRVSFQLQWNY